MGLAASQARFLCITARKADCEYQSTELAQQKLEITNQISDISNEYANAMNATKLVWSNDIANNDYGLTYSLLMTPSVMNDYNPYMVTSPAGAVILNNEYAAAARAAGISKAGGVGSQESRDKFIQALVPGGIVTQETADSITVNDYRVSINNGNISIADGVATAGSVSWNPSAGMGADPLNKSVVDAMTLYDLAISESIGQQLVDWGQLFVAEGSITKVEYDRNYSHYTDMINDATSQKITNEIVAQLEKDQNTYLDKYKDESSRPADYDDQVKRFDDLILAASKVRDAKFDENGILNDMPSGATYTNTSDTFYAVMNQLKADRQEYKNANSAVAISAGNADGGGFNVSQNSLDAGKYTLVQNGSINYYQDEINSMTIGDILTSNIVLMGNSNITKDGFMDSVEKVFDSIVAILGYSPSEDLSGTGLNIDDDSAKALEFAYKMMKTQYFRQYKTSTGSRYSKNSMTDNSAYLNAEKYNGFVTDDKSGSKYKGVSLTNMLSTFLTYYDNGLNGVDSPYAIGTTVDTSVYVTDNSSYYYLAQDDPNSVKSIVNKSADFFDQLYNNICEHGWREDAAIDDYEYLESAIKDGRYSLSSLNQDGYFYQTRYNETGYLIEESDTDAIARAEAEFTSKKAELTYKEDSIDLKTKKLDAEISSLTTEYDTVKTLISNSISKTFALFQN